MRRALSIVALSNLLAVAALAGGAPAGPATEDTPPPSTSARLFPPAGSPTLDAAAGEPVLDAIGTADPCDVGRAIGRMGACLTPEDCAALRLWERRFGPARPAPVASDRRDEATSAAAAEDSSEPLGERRGAIVHDLRAARPQGSARSLRPPFAPCPAGHAGARAERPSPPDR